MNLSILRYTCSLLLLIMVSNLQAQGEEEEIPETRIRGLRVGYDLSRHALPYLDGGRSGFEVSADMELKLNLYAAVEYGMLDVAQEATSFDYKSNGYYFRAGVDYNFLKNLNLEQYEMVVGGARIGYSSLNHSVWGIEVPVDYWGKEVGLQAIDQSTVQTAWLEIVWGVKAELLKNIFIGWSIRGRLRLFQTNDELVAPIYTPGYGRGEKRTHIGFTYSVYYRIPMMHYTPKPKKEE